MKWGEWVIEIKEAWLPPFFVAEFLIFVFGMRLKVGKSCIFANGGGWVASFPAFGLLVVAELSH